MSTHGPAWPVSLWHLQTGLHGLSHLSRRQWMVWWGDQWLYNQLHQWSINSNAGHIEFWKSVTWLKDLILVQPYGHFCQFCYFYFFIYICACVNANCINFDSGVYFYWNFNIPPSFPLINLFYTRYKKSEPLGTFQTNFFNRSAV